MNTKILMTVKRFQHSIGYCSNTHLKSTAVIYHSCDDFSNPKFIFTCFQTIIFFRKWSLMKHHSGKSTSVNQTITMRTWHLGINLCNKHLCRIHCCPGYIYRSTQTTISMFIGWRNLNNRHIYRHIIAKQIRNITQENRNKISPSFIYSLTNRLRYKHTVDPEMTFILRFIHFYIPLHSNKNEFHIV